MSAGTAQTMEGKQDGKYQESPSFSTCCDDYFYLTSSCYPVLGNQSMSMLDYTVYSRAS